jgi:hypothetical protein
MAFCPNCGTPNTEQAERCVTCGFELIVPKQKAKFKGTIMMSGIKAPTASTPEAPSMPPPPAASPAAPPPPSSPPPARNLSYQKTMMGQPPVVLPPKADPPLAQPARPAPPPDLAIMPTMLGNDPVAAAGPSASTREPAPDVRPEPALGATHPGGSAPMRPIESKPQGASAGYGSSGGFQSSGGASSSHGNKPTSFGAGSGPTLGGPVRTSMGSAYESTMPPAAPPNPAKVIAVGCAVVLALLLLVGGALWLAFGDRIKALLGGDGEAGAAEAAAWHASIAQSLTKVNELCQTDCAQAGVFFHPLKQAALLGEARALTPARLAKLNDPVNASAAMLDRTEDSAIATQLGLDPQQCARVVSGGARVVSCSVPDPNGRPSVLRIVQLSGITSL